MNRKLLTLTIFLVSLGQKSYWVRWWPVLNPALIPNINMYIVVIVLQVFLIVLLREFT